METIREQKLNVTIPKELHYEIKKRALFRNITLRKWLILAIIEYIKKEQKTE